MAEEKSKKLEEKKIAAVRIRGIIGITRDIDRTLNQLRLHRKNYCVVVPNDKASLGMLMKVKDYITWGEVDDTTFNLLVDKRGQESKVKPDSKGKIKDNKTLNVDGKNIKKFFRLNSPKKGYGRKGIKIPFNKGGALGYRADKIKDLIQRMI